MLNSYISYLIFLLDFDLIDTWFQNKIIHE